MIAPTLSWLRLCAGSALLALACGACTWDRDGPEPPATAEPAAPVAVTPAKDRGRQAAGTLASGAAEGAFSHIEAGDAERAASKRGHDSAAQSAAGAPQGPGQGGG